MHWKTMPYVHASSGISNRIPSGVDTSQLSFYLIMNLLLKTRLYYKLCISCDEADRTVCPQVGDEIRNGLLEARKSSKDKTVQKEV
jgi:hypothetical protein